MVAGQVVDLGGGAGVPIETEPVKDVDGLLVGAGFGARGVEVFDAEGDVPVVLSGEGPVDQKGACVAEVQGAGGGGGQSCAVGGHGRIT